MLTPLFTFVDLEKFVLANRIYPLGKRKKRGVNECHLCMLQKMESARIAARKWFCAKCVVSFSTPKISAMSSAGHVAELGSVELRKH